MKTLNLIIYVIILSRKHLLSINNVASCSVFFNDYNQMTVTLLKLVIKTLNTLKYKIIFSNFVFFQTRAESNNGDILPLYSLPPLAHIYCYQSHIILHHYIISFPHIIDVVSLATQFMLFDLLIYISHLMPVGWGRVGRHHWQMKQVLFRTFTSKRGQVIFA